ncbi:hypothetical protein ACI8B_130014 [Acinetobacter proteolyticus]|uniref:Uncharacterized protein n=1 Tax=Acinetobacter proteolyticus TaxID=1776741 RepID=A0A653K375_9GAMM|nr:hypothetical protein ACI8B_130014 [Acinetobacter proteolyticus]
MAFYQPEIPDTHNILMQCYFLVVFAILSDHRYYMPPMQCSRITHCFSKIYS